ncbi:hypothetical protein DI09_10p40 [Mitosporidium daphniae]|uniref:Uncharacterized protein n=1 Tax=Mitosporidium daphniae TaxID=1485682 RepID=A0A098VVX6_9MICR|nr:uncharacterized protein DI09_10p40 [Mitosporidium daphniae]KGG53107.1 hypothetical protein DI09_10p40 [Mitosporidium daphniae]|eukprot:XP_013239582.1 uncharacterized protein DI09_10p40 [Mitosporidium daphniae]
MWSSGLQVCPGSEAVGWSEEHGGHTGDGHVVAPTQRNTPVAAAPPRTPPNPTRSGPAGSASMRHPTPAE